MDDKDRIAVYVILGIAGLIIVMLVFRYIIIRIRQITLGDVINYIVGLTIAGVLFFVFKQKFVIAACLACLFFIEFLFISIIIPNRYKSIGKKSVKKYGTDISETDYMEGQEFEYWCAALLRKNGFRKVVVTPLSGDQGVDITANKDGESFAIQCKRFRNNLGNKPVQEVYAGKTIYGCTLAAVMTNSYFTPGAIEAAHKTGVLLWDRDTLKQMLAIANKKELEENQSC